MPHGQLTDPANLVFIAQPHTFPWGKVTDEGNNRTVNAFQVYPHPTRLCRATLPQGRVLERQTEI